MITSLNHAHPWIFVGPFLMALAACPPDNKSGTTADPEDADTTSDASTSTTAAAPTSSGQPSTTTDETSSGQPSMTTGETTESFEPDTTSTASTSTSSTSTTTLDPETTGGEACPVDLTISLALGFDQCDESLVLIATVHNVGTVDQPAGLDVGYYEGIDASGLKLATKPTSEALPAGSSTDVVWVLNASESSDYYVEVDSGPLGGSIVECDENNNGALVTDAACPD